MASLKEAFEDIDAQQSQFFQEQQAKYQESEPNRLLPDLMKQETQIGVEKANIGADIVFPATKLLSDFNPYTGKTSSQFSALGLRNILQGEAPVTKQEEECRTYVGLAGLNQLIQDTANEPFAPARCGWRYKKSPDSYTAAVAQGVLGTKNGPLNNNAPEDSLAGGVKYIWNLKDAKKIMLRDIGNYFASPESLEIVNNVMNGQLKNQLGWCATTNRMIPINPDGKPSFPNDTTLNCPPGEIYTDPARLPPAGDTTNSLRRLETAKLDSLKDCIRSGKNSSLSRDCLLMAVKNSGCTEDGSLYQSLYMASPSASKWDTFLNTQPSFQAYQSRQGDNAITATLFEKGKGTWQVAQDSIERLHKTTMTAKDPYVRVAAQDMCLESGKFDSYDFCADITDDTDIGTIDINCIKNFWQQENGKPAGLAYPRDKNFHKMLRTALGEDISNWGRYKRAVKALKSLTLSTDPKVQRMAISHFYGVQVSNIAFSPRNVEGRIIDESEPCLGMGTASPDGKLRFYSKTECDELGGNFYPSAQTGNRQGECLIKSGGSLSYNCRFLNEQESPHLSLWLDATDGSTLIIDGKNGVRTWRDKSGKNRNMIQNTIVSRPRYSRAGGIPGIVFDGQNDFFMIPNAYDMVRTQFCIFIVEKRSSDKIYNIIMQGTDELFYKNLHLGYRTNEHVTMDTYGYAVGGTVAPFQGSLEPIRVWSFGQTGNEMNIYLNGSAVARDTNKPPNLQSWNGAALGRNTIGYYSGTIYEILIYSRGFTNADRQKVEGYLAHKYGVADNLPATHQYKSSPP